MDVNYAIHYPLMKPYSALYPKTKNQKADDSEDAEGDDKEGKSKSEDVDGPKGDVDMWRAIEQAMEEGTLEKLRYSKDAVPAQPPKKAKKPVKESKKDRTNGTAHMSQQKASSSKNYTAQDEDEESDGGFFE